MATMTEPQRLSQPSSADALPEAPPYLWAGLVALGALILYVATLAPTTQFWDTSEYIAAAYVLGIPHPPGNPLFTLIAHTWGLLPLAAAYAERINLLAAVTSAIAASRLIRSAYAAASGSRPHVWAISVNRDRKSVV